MIDGLKKRLSLRTEAEHYAASLPALMLEAEKIAASISHGEHTRRKAGAGQKFWQFRDYVSGDRPQEIDWRQSAKTDHIFIRQKEQQTTQKTYFWCASGQGMLYSSDKKLNSKHDCGAIISMTLALLLMRAEEQIGVFGENRTGRSEQKIEALMDIFLDNNRKDSLPQSSEFILPRHSNLILTGDFLSPPDEIEASFSLIAASADKALVIQILDPSELDLNFNGRILFESETEKETINHVQSIRKQYQERIQNQIEALKSICQRNNWSHYLHRTDTDLTSAINKLWERNSAQEARKW